MDLRQYLIVGASAVLTLVFGVIIMNTLFSKKEEQTRKAPLAVAPEVSVTPVKYQDLETELEYYGRVSSFRSVDIIAEVQGKLIAGTSNLKAGSRIRNGQLLYRIDDTETRLNLQSQKSQFMKSIADILADLKVDYPGRFPVWQAYFESIEVEKPLPDLPKVADLKEKTFLSTRGIQSSYYNILSAQERLSKYRIYAPFTGSLSVVMMDAGSVVSPGSRIATLLQTDRLELALPVKADDMQWIKTGTKVEVSSQDGKQSWTGTVARMGEKIDAATQSVNVYISITPRDEAPILDGQYLKATVPGKVVIKAMEIPRKAIFNEDKIYVVRDGKLKIETVSVHRINPKTILFSGLKEGERIVADPPVNAIEDMSVKVSGTK